MIDINTYIVYIHTTIQIMMRDFYIPVDGIIPEPTNTTTQELYTNSPREYVLHDHINADSHNFQLPVELITKDDEEMNELTEHCKYLSIQYDRATPEDLINPVICRDFSGWTSKHNLL